MIDCQQLTLPFGLCAGQGLTSQFLAGQRWAILGPNGTGKSIFLSCLAGWMQAAGGNIEWAVEPGRADAHAWAKRVAYQPAQVLQVFSETLAARLQLQQQAAQRLGASPLNTVAVEKLVSQFGLVNLLHSDLTSASSGEQQRAWLATCLLQPAAALLFDEPLSHLDFAYQEALGQCLQADPRLSLCVVHQPEWARRYCTHALALTARGFHSLSIDQLDGKVLADIYGVPFHPARTDDGKIHWIR
jgi:iron complex transport system ATP-binding protein